MKRFTIMGILNVTPDSFSDGGRYYDQRHALDHAMEMIDEGADIIDVGGESSRPGAREIEAAEELERVLPVIKGIRNIGDIGVSIDTRKSSVARAALDAGATMINDISAGEHDPEMFRLAAERGCAICLMHMKGTPETMQKDTTYNDVVAEIIDYLARRIGVAEEAGIDPERIIIDPGIGFGKSADDNITILLNIDRMEQLGKQILVGTSRKSFIGKKLGYDLDERLEPTLATLSKSYERGARMFRVHDVGAAKRYLSMVQLLNA